MTPVATVYRLELPRWDVGPCIPYRTAHWSQRSKAVAEVIDAVGWLWRAAKLTSCSHLTIRLVWAPGDHRRADSPNLAGLQKPCTDSLVRIGLVPDDTAEWVTELMPRIDRPPVPAGLWLELEIRP